MLPPSSQLRQRSAKQSLVKAFRSFTNAAGSLESTYSLLQAEVALLLEPFLPRLVVLSPAEIPATVTIQSVGVLR